MQQKTKSEESAYTLAKICILGALLFLAYPLFLGFTKTILFELKGGLTWDSPIYWAVGRGILNGLVPYVDLFETKPPGIFLLSSASLWLFGNLTLGYIVQAAAVFSICGVCTYLAYNVAGDCSVHRRMLYALVGFVFGSTLAFYVSWRSGLYQVESFGASFALIYLAAIYKQHKLSKVRFAIATISLGLSLGFKEPFLLSIAAGAMLLTQSVKEFFQLFVLPLVSALILGTAILYALGFLEAYVQVYLFGEMLSNFINGTGTHFEGSAAMRALNMKRVWLDLHNFAPQLGYVIGLLSAAYLFFRLRHEEKIGRFVTTISLFLVALYLTSFTVGLGGHYYNHHFVFGIPFYAALFLTVLYDVHYRWETGPMRLALVPVALLSVMAFSSVPQKTHNFSADIMRYNIEAERAQYAALQIDTILDRCNHDRYMFLGPNGIQPFGYTRHSPLGPMFFQLRHLMTEEREYFREKFVESLMQAQFIVFDSLHVLDLNEDVLKYLDENFSTEPWECVGEYGKSDKYKFYYRNQ